MYRIFKKSSDLAARTSDARARRPRRQRLAVEALEGRQLMTVGLNDFLVNVNTFGTQFFSDNASSANGMHMAVWASDDGFVGGNVIKGQLYNASGFRVGSDNLLITFGEARVTSPHVAMDANGNSVVVYQQTVNGQTDIIAKRITLNPTTGLPVLGNQIVVANSTVNEHDADVAMDAKGNFVVSYTVDLNSNDKDIQAALFTSSGARIGFVNDPHLVTGDHDETRSSVAMSPDGRFDIAYQSTLHGGSTNIHLAQFSAGGVNTTDEQILSPTGALNPSVAMDSAGNAVVAYQTVNFGGTGRFANLFDIVAQRFNSAGAEIGFTDITLSGIAEPPVNNVLPSVALSPTGGSYVVGYQAQFHDGSRNVAVAEVNGSDTIVGALGLPTSPNYVAPALSIAGNGKYLFTFDAFDNGGADRNIHGRFGSLPVAPAAQNLALTSPIKAGQSATLSGQLTDAAGNKKLALTVNWGDGSEPQQSHPGLKPFALMHKYIKTGTYKVHVTWTDNITGLSNSRDLILTVKKAK
jgi:hypothetical protein